MSRSIHRRAFGGAAAAAAAAATLVPGRVFGANERLGLGFIGVGNRGCQLLAAFLAQPDAEIVALCDVYEPYLHAAYDRVDPRFRNLGGRIPKMAALPREVDRVRDFRRLLDRKDIDAVVIATPDHWHAIQTIQSCQAGKDVYVEKPLSMTIVEGRAMVEAARRHDRVVQVGTHRRSSRMYAELAEKVRAGALGKVTVARIAYASNMTPKGIGKAPDSAPPPDLDWDLWLGPPAGPAVQREHPAVQVPLASALFLADGELGGALLRPGALADRRVGPGVGLGARGAGSRWTTTGRSPIPPRRSSSTPRGC